MTQEHPITPSDQLISDWCASKVHASRKIPLHVHIAIQAARWGADQELEACCESLRGEFNYHHLAEPLRAVRRPKPPSLKELALEALNRMDQLPTAQDQQIIRRALEQLND